VVVKGAVRAREVGARDVAARVVGRVIAEDAFAAAVLEAELARAVQLEPRDRALATELVYGALRVLPWLRAEIARFATRGIAKLDARMQAHLVVAAYQLFFTRVPAFAAVSQAVEGVRAERGEKMAGFANAVLRKVAGRAASLDETARAEAIVESTPAWLQAALERSLGAEGARAMIAGTEPPAVALRVERREERDAWLARLRAEVPGATFEAGRTSPQAILARGAGRPQSLPGFAEGAWTVQEEGSQLAALALGARPGEEVLDACAGRGNKTGILARAVGAAGAVDACDTSLSKLDRLVTELARIGLVTRERHAVDWTLGPGDATRAYDRVLVDAPCTGVGTLRRRPEIALRLKEDDVAAKARVQVAIASRAADRVRPGGSMVYVVCSVLREEGEDVAAALLAARGDLAPAPFEEPEVVAAIARGGGDAGGASFRLLPHVHGTDGYFVARFTRR
jgi:16S rRNA (cytosine967-C5)-methyltransferase